MPETPIKNAYWVLPGQFLAGEYPRNLDEDSSKAKVSALLQAGVSAFIDLTHPADGLYPYQQWLGSADYHPFPIIDGSIPNSATQTRQILDTIDSCINQKQIVYVHCWGGIGRTGVIVGCWLSENGYPGPLALDRLKNLWQACPKSAVRPSPETPAQAQYIISWQG